MHFFLCSSVIFYRRNYRNPRPYDRNLRSTNQLIYCLQRTNFSYRKEMEQQHVRGSRICQSGADRGEREPITQVWGQNTQQGRGTEPPVGVRGKPSEAESFASIFNFSHKKGPKVVHGGGRTARPYLDPIGLTLNPTVVWRLLSREPLRIPNNLKLPETSPQATCLPLTVWV